MSSFKRKKVAAAAFTFLMALSTISGATIASADIDTIDDQNNKEPINTNNAENPDDSSTILKLTYLSYQNLIERYNPGLDNETRDTIYDSAYAASQKYNVPLELIIAIIGCESEFKPGLYGSLDDTGLMQVRLRYASSWAKAMGVSSPENRESLTDIKYNIDMGTFILSYLLNKFDNNIHHALVAYNAGEGFVGGRLSRSESIPTYYMDRVSIFYKQITSAALW